MILIIGGVYQGKFDYAMSNYEKHKIINKFHLEILDNIKVGLDPLEEIKKNISFYKDKVIIYDDISCGVVPTEPLMRQWREACGHCMAYLSANADEVIRLFCGIPTKIK